jgi:biotin-[acetyl-CoA-carboxylase] ligase BirA-like protein
VSRDSTGPKPGPNAAARGAKGAADPAIASPVANQVIARCGSTNDLARELGERGAPHGTWVSAREQEKGRGRLGRQWQSLEGNLFLSLVARIEDKSRWTWVPLATAVAAARMIEAREPALGSRLRIKWPNDLWLVPEGSRPGAAGAKLGGVLCEAVGNRSGSFIVIGLGLNCAHAPPGLDQETISLSEALGREVTADDVRDSMIQSLLRTLDELAQESVGSAGIVRDYERLAAFPQSAEVEWASPSPSPSPGSSAADRAAAGAPQRGRVLGLGPMGELVVTTAGGEELKLYAEDVKVRSGSPKASCGSLA